MQQQHTSRCTDKNESLTRRYEEKKQKKQHQKPNNRQYNVIQSKRRTNQHNVKGKKRKEHKQIEAFREQKGDRKKCKKKTKISENEEYRR